VDRSRLARVRRGSLVTGLVLALGWGLLAPAASASNDPFFDRQWALQQIGAPQAWQVSRGAGITVGIVDTGVDAAHPDLAGKVAFTADCVGRAACADGAASSDPSGHGTLVAGVVTAGTGNGRGVAAVAPDSRIVVARVLGPNGEGRAEDVNLGIRWAVDHGARVINLSLGDPNFVLNSVQGTPLRAAIDYAWGKGAVPVLASGNYGSGGLGSQNYGNLNAIVVGATDRSGGVAGYSSPVGTAKWGVVAPGGSGASGPDNNVISTATGGGYASSAGTSMAAPHVSAAIALLLAQGLTPSAAVNRLLATADKVPCGTGCKGRLNLAAATGAGPLAPTAAPPPPAKAPAPPATSRARATTTTVAPTTTSTSTTSTTTPSPPESESDVIPSGLAAGPDLSSTGDSVDPVVAAAAALLLLVVGGALALVAAQRRLASLPIGQGVRR
jgi:subtilisin family serine protease